MLNKMWIVHCLKRYSHKGEVVSEVLGVKEVKL